MKNPNIGEKGVFWGLEAAGIQTQDGKKSTCPACSHDRRKSSDKCLSITSITTKEGGAAWNVCCHHCGYGEGVLILDDNDWRNQQEREKMQANSERPAPRLAIKKLPEKVYKLPTPQAPTLQFSNEFLAFWQGRGISAKTLMAAGVGECEHYMPELKSTELAARFPIQHDGRLLSYKYRAIRQKTFAIEAGTELVLVGAQALSDAKKEGRKVICIVVEGEVDYLSALELGMATMDGRNGRIVVSVPNGVNSLNCLKKHFDNKDFDCVERFLLLTDNDTAGVGMRDEFARRVGSDKCGFFQYPNDCKDLNDVHLKLPALGGDIWQHVTEIVPPIQGIDTVWDVWGKLAVIREDGNPKYCKTGITTLDELFSWHLGAQLTALSAPPNSGKTDFILSVAMRLAYFHGAKFGIMSPETGSSAEIYDALAKCYIGKMTSEDSDTIRSNEAQLLGIANQDEYNQAMVFIANHFFVYSCEEPTMRTGQMLDIAEQLVKRHGINMLICDPYNFLEDAFSDPENSREMMSNYINSNLQRIKHWSQKNDVHVVVVPHPKALAPYEPMSDFGQINGGAAWGNKCDNVIFINRLFSDTEKIRGGEERKSMAEKHQDDMQDKTLGDKVEVVIRKVKKRYAGKIGTTALAYRIPTGQFGDPADPYNPSLRAAQFLSINQSAATVRYADDENPFE